MFKNREQKIPTVFLKGMFFFAVLAKKIDFSVSNSIEIDLNLFFRHLN